MLQNVSSDKSTLSELESLRKENAELKSFRLICENMPVPMLLTLLSDSSVVYANRPASCLFGLSMDEMMKSKTIEFYNTEDRQSLLDSLALRGFLSNYELRCERRDHSVFWAELFVQPLKFNDKHCLLSIWYDITERKNAEQEIARLNKILEDQEKEGKYLIFTLSDEYYGISILKIQNIITMRPVTPLIHAPDFIEGVINLRDSIIPVINLRKKFELESSENTNHTCIIIVEISFQDKKLPDELKNIGIVVDSVSDVLSIKGKAIKDIPEFEEGINWDYISGIAITSGKIIPIINIDYVLNSEDIAMIDI